MNGIIILSLKKAAYSMGAFNLAQSIKYFNPDVNITLVSDDSHQENFHAIHYKPFDQIKKIDPMDCIDTSGRFQPGIAKINIYKYSQYEHTLFIDADSIVLKDVQPLIDSLILSPGNFHSNAIGRGYFNEEIEYSPWASNEQIWSYFALPQDRKIITINSSWFYFNKTSHDVFKKARKSFHAGFKESDLKLKWGATLPDELFFVGALAQLEIDPKFDQDVMFFGNNIDKRSLSEIENDFFAFTLYGNTKTVRDVYVTWYDRLMFKYCDGSGIDHKFKAHNILSGKHVNK